MALADYYRCDKCQCKALYDADIDWENSRIGDMRIICKECAKQWRVEILPNEPSGDKSQ